MAIRFRRSWIHLLLALLTAFLCTLVSPVFAKFPIAKSAVSNLPNNSATTVNLVQQGKTLYDAGQFSEAVKVLQQAASDFKAQGDRPKQAMTLSNLSLAYQQLGLWSEATKAIADSLNLLGYPGKRARGAGVASVAGGEIQNLEVLAQTLNTQGRLQLTLGQPEQALNTWQQAATIYTQAGDSTGIIQSQINLAQAMQALGLYRRALATLTKVNQTLQKQPDSLLKIAGLRNLGNALQVVGDLDQSKQVLQQSLAMAENLRSRKDIGAALLSLGNLARQQDTKAALAFYQQAATTSLSHTTKLQAQLNQLNLLLETQQAIAAGALLPQLQSQIDNLPPSHTGIYARIDFAQSLMKLRTRGNRGPHEVGIRGEGDKETRGQGEAPTVPPPSPNPPISLSFSLSPSSIAQVLATAVQQAQSLGDRRAEAYALGSLGGLYEQTQQWSSAQKLTQEALFKAEAINAPDIAYRWQWQLGRLLKAQGDISGAIAAYSEAVNILKSLRNDLVAINPDIQFNFRDNVEPVYRELVELLLPSQETSEISQKNLVQARATIESLQLAELDNFFRIACLSAQPVLIDQVVDKDNQTAAVIYPIILADRLEVILKLPQQQKLRHYTMSVPQRKVEDTLEQLRQNLEKPYTSPEGKFLSQQLYDWLIRPAEADLSHRIETLVFVLDGSLRNIPIAALYDGKQYLIQKYSVALAPGLSLLNPKPLSKVSLKALAAGLTQARLGFSALTNVGVELNEIKSEVPSKVLLNQHFTSIAFQKQLNSSPFPIVHLATHGQFSSNPDETFILAWDKPIKVNELSYLLQSPDQSRPNAIELLVLSACETATGDKRAALGLAGVAARSGVRSTLASLWNVDDESSALLLSKFYRELAKTPVNKAQALRRAQLTLLKNPTYRHPLFWASYVLVGNWL